MITSTALVLYGLLSASSAVAQVYETDDRSEDAFTWIQPEDTVVLGQYGHSEPVYPSREFILVH